TIRLERNWHYFLSNYAFICLITLIYGVLFRPLLLFLTVFLAGLGYWSLVKMDAIVVGDVSLSGRKKVMAFVAICVVLVFLFAGSTIFTILGICTTLIGLHGAFHGGVRFR